MKKIIGSLLISTAVIGFSCQVKAAEGVTINETNKQVISDATIKVNPGEETPTKPENPDTPSGETEQNGPLSLDNVIVFNFQDMNLKGTTQKISLKNDGVESLAKRNIQVTDTRGTGAGWNLKIKQSELTDATTTPGTTKTLKGAYITLNNGIVVAGNDNVSSDDTTLYPTLDKYVVDKTSKGEFQKLVTAEENQGLGTFKIYYNQDENGVIKENADDIQLVVPSGSLIGSYKGTVTWALSDSPSGKPAS